MPTPLTTPIVVAAQPPSSTTPTVALRKQLEELHKMLEAREAAQQQPVADEKDKQSR